jgi:monomeric isocitrate dehydrogenase
VATSKELEEERKTIAMRVFQLHGVAVDVGGYNTRQLKDIERMLDQSYTYHKLNDTKNE